MKLFARFITTVYLTLFYRVEIVNVGKVPEKGAAILCGNHRAMLDMFFIGFKLKRWIHWMAKEELFRNPILGAIFSSLGAFPVKRGKGDIGSIKKAFKLLESQHIIGIFPLGTRKATENGKNTRIKPGAAMLAANSGAPIIPVAITGGYKLFSKVRVIFGDPVRPELEEGKKLSSDELADFSKTIMDRIFSLMEE